LKAILIETLIGIFAYNEEGIIIDKTLYPKDPQLIASIIRTSRQGDLTPDFRALLERLKTLGVDQLFVLNHRLIEYITKQYGFEEAASDFTKVPDVNVVEMAIRFGHVSSREEFGKLSHLVNTQLAEWGVHDALANRESLLIPVVQLLGDLDTILNSLSGRMREWYGVHFPELGRRVKDHEEYAKIILRFGVKDNITAKSLQELSFKKREAETIVKVAADSMGADLYADDVEAIKVYTLELTELFKEREKLIGYLSQLTEEVAPNVAFLCGPVLGAKLIQKAGGLRRMSMIPASTIQVLGAEKAMFRTLKTHAKPPKYGLLYQHPYVHSATKEKRGSRARSLAAKIAIAARADVFSGEFIADELKKQLPEE
jgi:nucleolar protein 56